MSDIGFLLITHQKPHQIRRLVARLQKSFQSPKIVCHHNFSQCALAEDDLPPGVTFVRPHIETRWGHFSTVLAILASIRTLYAASDSPEWFVVLSGADYPIKSGVEILDELKASPYDTYVCHELIDPNHIEPEWHRLCCERYLGAVLNVPYLGPLHLPGGWLPWLDRPFSRRFRCFEGEMWFTANRKAAEYILAFHRDQRALAQRYAHRRIPDESYVHCIVGNATTLSVANDSKRYTDWSQGGPHPKVLTMEDLPALLASDAHFARKFDPEVDSLVLDRLDEIHD